MVQTKRTLAKNRFVVLWQSYQQCFWLPYCFCDPRQNGRYPRLCSLAVRPKPPGVTASPKDLIFRWLFFIEGAITVFVALCAIYILPDFPDTSSSWLTPAEKALAQRRMMEDAGVDDALKISGHTTSSSSRARRQASMLGLIMALSDLKVWWLALSLTAMVVSLSFNAYFPTLSATLGYNTTVTLLLCVPPWVFATIIALAVSRYLYLLLKNSTLIRNLVCRHSDHTGERCWHIVIPILIGMIGFLIAMLTMNTALRYLSL